MIAATLELTQSEVDTLYFILRRVGGRGRGRNAASSVLRAIECLDPREPADLRAGHPFPAPIDLLVPLNGIFLYQKSPAHLLRSLRRRGVS